MVEVKTSGEVYFFRALSAAALGAGLLAAVNTYFDHDSLSTALGARQRAAVEGDATWQGMANQKVDDEEGTQLRDGLEALSFTAASIVFGLAAGRKPESVRIAPNS